MSAAKGEKKERPKGERGLKNPGKGRNITQDSVALQVERKGGGRQLRGPNGQATTEKKKSGLVCADRNVVGPRKKSSTCRIPSPNRAKRGGKDEGTKKRGGNRTWVGLHGSNKAAWGKKKNGNGQLLGGGMSPTTRGRRKE